LTTALKFVSAVKYHTELITRLRTLAINNKGAGSSMLSLNEKKTTNVNLNERNGKLNSKQKSLQNRKY